MLKTIKNLPKWRNFTKCVIPWNMVSTERSLFHTRQCPCQNLKLGFCCKWTILSFENFLLEMKQTEGTYLGRYLNGSFLITFSLWAIFLNCYCINFLKKLSFRAKDLTAYWNEMFTLKNNLEIFDDFFHVWIWEITTHQCFSLLHLCFLIFSSICSIFKKWAYPASY